MKERLALFVLLGQTAQRAVTGLPDVAPQTSLSIGPAFDLAIVLPGLVKRAEKASEVYKLFFVFENFLRDFVLQALSEADPINWWERVPPDVRDEVDKLEDQEDKKQWMALSSRSKLALTTLPQLLRIIEEKENWKGIFENLVKDKALPQQARVASHIRNTACHMSDVSDEEIDRVKQMMRDWFRIVAP